MLIERAEFLSRQASGLQSFNFKPDRLNLLSTDEDQKKSCLFSSISFVLWGKGAQDAEAAAGSLERGTIELETDGKKVTLIRDFNSNQLELKADESLKAAVPADLFSGVSKDIYQSLFLVGQDEGSSSRFVDRGTLLSFLGQFADVSENSLNIEKSVKLVEEKLDRYPFHGKTYRVVDLVVGLTRGKTVLEERLVNLERERKDSCGHIAELDQLEKDLAKARRTQKREEYFQLCLETADLDARIMKVQQRLLHEAELKAELAELADLADFPINSLRKVQELWTMRQARISDRDRLSEEIAASRKELEFIEEACAKDTVGLEQFLIEDAQQLYGLATVHSSAQQEIVQLRSDRTQEMRRLKDEGVDFDSISLVRKFILSLDPPDLEEANRLAYEAKRKKDKLANLVALSENTSNQLKVVSEEIALFSGKSRRVKDVLFVLTVVSALLVTLVFLIPWQAANEMVPLVKGIFLASFGLSLAALLLLPRVHAGMCRDFEAKVDGLVEKQNKFGADELAMSDTIAFVQDNAERIAKQYGLSSTGDLFKKLQVYRSISARLKQLDVLDHMLSTREKQLASLNAEAMTYFEKIDRKLIQVTPAAVTGLASEILRHKESLRELEHSSVLHNHRIAERRFLEGEILDLDGVLRDHFRKARLLEPEKLESAFAEFEQKAQLFGKQEKLALELQSLEKSSSAEILEQDLSTLLHKLQHRRTDAWTSMQDLIARYPEILTETIEDSEIGRLSQRADVGMRLVAGIAILAIVVRGALVEIGVDALGGMGIVAVNAGP